jgi:hypothetical protein
MFTKLKAWSLSRPERGLFVGMLIGITLGTIIEALG